MRLGVASSEAHTPNRSNSNAFRRWVDHVGLDDRARRIAKAEADAEAEAALINVLRAIILSSLIVGYAQA